MKKSLFFLTFLLTASFVSAQDFRFVDLGNGTVMFSYRIYLDEYGNEHRLKNSYEGDIVIPETYDGKPVSRIDKYTFDECVNLTSVTIPNTVDSIGGDAFLNCTSLAKLTIEDSASPLKLHAISGNYWGMFDTYYNHLNSLEYVYLGRDIITKGHSAFSNPVIKTLTMGDNVTRVEDEAFRDCRGLRSVTTSPNLTYIGRQAFYQCDTLSSISIPDGVSTIGKEAFIYCRALESVQMPVSLTLIQESTFSNCNSLKEIIIPAAVDSVGRDAFLNCTSLAKLTIEDSASPLKLHGSSGNYWGMFDTYYNHLNSLKEVFVGRNLSVTGGHSPFNNENIEILALGHMVTNIYSEDYANCNPASLYSLATVPPTCTSPNVFKEINKQTCALCVPEDCIDAYKTAYVWSEFFNIISGIKNKEVDMAGRKGDAEPEFIQRYTLDGLVGGQERGLNIVRMSNGTVRKIFIK